MAKYAELADGRVLEFPDDTPQDVMDKVVKRAVENPYSTYTTEDLKKAAPAPSSLRDLNEAGALGLAGGIKAFTDLFGVNNAASKKMEELQKQAFNYMTPERQREMAIEDELSRRASEEGTWASIKEGARQVARSPAQGIVSGLFSSAPIIAATALAPAVTVPGAITGLAGRAGAAGLAGRGLSKVIASSPAIAVGAGMGVGSQKGQDYQRVKEEMLARGASEEEAESAAQKAAEYSMENAARQAAAGVAGGVEGAVGVESLLGRAGRARAGVRGGPEAPTWGKAAGQSTVGEAIPEGVQSAVGGIGSNIALQQAGIDTDLLQGVAGDVTRDTLIGALTGTAVTPLQMRQLRQEFARDQLEKQSEEQRKLLEELQKKQAEIAKTKEQLGTKEGLALPAPAPKVEEQDPLQNPLGNLTKAELGPEVVGYIEQYRSANGMPLLNSYSIEDVKDAMTQVNPEGEAGALSSLVAAKSGYKPDVNYSAQDVLNAATDKVDTGTQGFKDFLRRTTGVDNLETMTQPQLYAAFKALDALPSGQGKVILPEGTNARRFTEDQMIKGLTALATELESTPALTPEHAISAIKEATGLENDRDAASIIKQLLADNNIDRDSDNNLIAPTKVENLPAGYTLEKGTFKQGEQQMYGAVRDGKPVEGVDTYSNMQDAQNKVDNLNKVREKEAENLSKRIEKIQEEIASAQQKLDAMEAAGEGGTDAYKKAKAQNDAFIEAKNQEVSDLNARQLMYQTPITAGPIGMKQVNRTGFTLFKDGIPVSTHPTADAAVDSLVGTLPEEEVKALADNKAPGMRTIARKARQRLEGKTEPKGIVVKKEAKPEATEEQVTEEKQKVQDLAEQLSKALQKFGLGKIELQIIKGMEDEGSYVANLIKIALDAKDAMGVLRHESIHALKDLGFFTDQQWNALTRMAKEKWIDQYLKGVAHDATRSRYDAYVDEYKGKISEAELESLLIEEAIADAFRAFGSKPPAGMIAALVKKIQDFFTRLANAFNNAGYQTAEDVFGKIEKGELEQEFAGATESDTKKPSLVNAWKATPAEVKQAETYEEKNGILPYISEGRLDLPTQIEKKSIKTADKYGLYQFDPVLNIPLNKDGTVTVYYHTTREEAKKINASKVIPSNGKARIYLTNESNGGPIVNNRGNFDQTLDGSTVLLNIDPSVLQVDQSYDNGRIDFFVPMAQGEYFNRKMRMASIQKGRKEAIVPTFSYKEHEDRITAALAEYNGLDSKAKKARLKQARSILKTEHNVGTLLTENGKLEKTRLGEFEIEGYDGKSIASMGLGMASAQQISDKVSTCNRSAICEGLCLGETSGGNFLYGGAAAEDVGDIQKSAFRAAARMFQYLKTEALIVHPEEFAIALQAEIDSLKRWSNKNDYDPAIRLNVTSDFKPSMFSGLIDANRDVMFYDYTKLNGDPIAPNHHLTYSSTGFGQVINGEPVFFKNKAGQYDHNWGAVRARLDEGYGVAMAFSSKSALPKFLSDEETGKTYQIWDGDLYDARFLDPKAEDGVTGQIVGLRNKAATLKEKTAAAETGGFFIDYDPKRDGDTVVVPDQSQFKGKKVFPIAKKSLRAPDTKEFKRWFGNSKVVDENDNPLVVYHATRGDFENFKDTKDIGFHFGSDFVANARAEELAKVRGKAEARTAGMNIMPVYLSIQNPLVLRKDPGFWEPDTILKTIYNDVNLPYSKLNEVAQEVNSKAKAEEERIKKVRRLTGREREEILAQNFKPFYDALRDALEAQGYDGIQYINEYEGIGDTKAQRRRNPENTTYVAFRPEQIKSATGNIGTYSSTSPDIRKSLRAPEWVPQNIWDLHEKSLAADAEASGEIARPKGISPGAAKRNQTMAFRRLNNAVMEFVGDDENKANDLMVRMNEESSRREGETEKKSLRAPDTKEFKDWFSDSKAVDKEGRPMVMYHGTARDIKVFKPKQAGAIFVTPDPEVGSIYSADSLKWVSENAKDELTEEQQAKAIADALAAAKEDFSYLSDPAERKQPDYKKLVAKRDSILKQIEKNSFGKKSLSEEALPYLANAVKEYLPVGENVMPVFVRALNPFDYENKKHLDMVISQIVMPSGQVSEKSKQEARELGVPTEYPEAKINALKSHLARGLYQKIESEEVQRAIRSLGFDSFYVKEHGSKNLGVYSPSQIKSATGNIGTYDIDNPDIRRSLRPQISSAAQTRINETIGKRDESSWLERLMNVIAPNGKEGFRQAYINRYETIGRKERMIAKMKGLPKIMADVSAESAALFSDYAAGITASAFGVHDGVGGVPVYRNGVTIVWNDNGKIKGPISIFAPLAKFHDPEVFRDWQFWVSAQRGARLDAEGREKLFTQADLTHARDIEAKYPKGLFESVRKEWDTYNRGLVDYMIQTGVINKAMGESWIKHGDYFPFYRQQMDSEAKGPKIFSAISGVKPPKELKGGTDTVGDFFENVIRNTQSAIEAGMKNVAAERAIQNELFLGDAKEILDPKGQPARPSGSQTNVVTVMRDGKMHYYECVDSMFVEAMKGLNMAEIPGLQLFAAPANLLRSFVTKTPDFILANLLRDSMSAWVTSGADITPVIDSVKGYASALGGKDKDVQTLLNAGLIGGHEFTGKTRESGKDFAKKLRKAAGAKTTKEKIFTPFTSVWEALEKGSTASDAATRLQVYKDTYAQTGNEAEALMRAMEIMNFQRKGNSALIRILTAVTPFLNARIQGIDVLYRAGIKPFTKTEDKTAYDQAVAKAFIKRGMSLMALSALYYVMVHDDDDYKAQEEETRDNNWLVPSLGIKIPIPFEVGVLFKVIPERLLAFIMGNDTGEQLMESAKRNLMSTFGIQLPQAILPAVEVATNYSFFTGRPIIGQGLEDVDKKFQIAPGTSKFAEMLGQITSFKTTTGQSYGLSPIQIDHLIKGYTGTLGTYAVDAMDTVIDLNSDIPKPSKRFEQMPFIRRFALDPDARGNVTAYYELKNAVDQAVRTSNMLERTGKVEDFAEYKTENMNLLASKDYVNQLYKQLKQFNDMKRQIRSSSMDGETKRDVILSIERAESALTSQIRDYRKMLSQ